MLLSIQYIYVISSSLDTGPYQQLGFSYMQLLISEVITNLVTLLFGILLDQFVLCSVPERKSLKKFLSGNH